MSKKGRARVGLGGARRSGIASAFNLYGSTRSFPEMRASIGALANKLGQGSMTDRSKLKQDWQKLGGDIRQSCQKVNPVNGK